MNKNMIKQLVKLQILCMRYVELHTSLRVFTVRDLERILTSNKLTCTYGEAVQNLKENIKKHCNNSDYLLTEILKLEDQINSCSLKDLRFGVNPQKRFTEEETSLDDYKTLSTFFYTGQMATIKDTAEKLQISDNAIKQACQQERLLNVKKAGRTWLVHIPECRKLWNVPDNEESHLYKDWIF